MATANVRVNDAAWKNTGVSDAQSRITILTVLDAVITFFTFLIGLGFGTPLLPPSVTSFGLFYVLPHLVSWIIFLAAGTRRSVLLVDYSIFFSLLLLVPDGWSLILLAFFFINCIDVTGIGVFLASTISCIVFNLVTFFLLLTAIWRFIYDIIVFFSSIEIKRHLTPYYPPPASVVTTTTPIPATMESSVHHHQRAAEAAAAAATSGSVRTRSAASIFFKQ